jgi:hypothetical protein
MHGRLSRKPKLRAFIDLHVEPFRDAGPDDWPG